MRTSKIIYRQLTSLETSTTRLSSLLSPSLSWGAKIRRLFYYRFSLYHPHWHTVDVYIDNFNNKDGNTHTSPHTDRYINITGCFFASFHWLSTMQHLTQRYYIPYILTEHPLHTRTISISLSFIYTRTVALSPSTAHFRFPSSHLSLPFSGVRTMALSHHGNRALMWSWPDIPIDISVEWHQYLIIQSWERAMSTVYS